MIDSFGTTQVGTPVRVATLRSGPLTARVLTLGGILQSLTVEGREMTLGCPDLTAYDNGPLMFFGALIGPVAGRIANARGPLDGGTLDLSATDAPHALHSGTAGLHAHVWDIADSGSGHVTLATTCPASTGGLPGTRHITARYTASDDALGLTLTAETDAPTWINLTQHSYWHLGGSPGIDGHRLRVDADRILPITPDTLPTGEIRAVDGTRFDFRTARPLTATDRLDHCFPLSDTETAHRRVATLSHGDGARLHLETTAPGLQIFTADGVTWGNVPTRAGLAFEAQDWPDAPNHAGFPSIRLAPGAPWRREIAWRFETA